jgi:hypothetical protein
MSKYHIELRTADRVWEALAVDTDDLTALRIEVSRFVGELLRNRARRYGSIRTGAWM